MNVPFKSLPGYNDLFIDYIDDFDSLRRFYEYDYRSFDDFARCIENTAEKYKSGRHFFRTDLSSILIRQNQSFGASQKAFENISLLNEHNTLAVVSGQQLGILTGPLYTVIKAINTIQLSDVLKSEFPSYNFVPVFWLEADDHDFLEINNTSVITSQNEIRKFSYFEKGTEQEKYLFPTGSIIFDGYIDSLVNELEDSLPKTDFSVELFRSVRENYSSGKSVKNAFAGFLNYILKDKGLIMIDPSDAQIKNLLKPVFERALRSSAELSEKIIGTTVEVEATHAAQVKPRAINLFYIHEGSRYLLEPRDGGNYALKNSRTRFTRDELFGKLADSPENFSWNVITRPVCQDFLMPTVAYIGGPSEVSYFAQLREAYKTFDMLMPVIYPRTSLTLLDGRTSSFIEKNGITFSELFNEKELTKAMLRNEAGKNPEDIFGKMKDELVALFYTYDKELRQIDINQASAFAKRSAQFVDSLEMAKERFVSSKAKQNEVLTGQVKKILASVFPDSMLQERLLNIIMYLNKYGPDLIEHMNSNVSIGTFMHQTVDLTAVNAR